jgi:hypothetical protein
MTDDNQIPSVFISYSHDSPAHKEWVVELAARLVENGVQVILDQWDLRPGDDVPKFMERSIRSAHRVLSICTETYTRKADEGVGGVGYESMVVSGEVMKELGTNKFIPVVKQLSRPAKLPAALSTRLFIDLSNAESYESEFQKLLRDIHRIPPPDKPALGQRPFASAAAAASMPRGANDPHTQAGSSEPAESVATRFIRLFEAHGVHRNQISRVLGHGLAPVHLQSDESLMPVLTDVMLDAAARQFAIRRDWLDGASDQIYPLHDFYKKPKEFGQFIAELRRQSKGALRGVVLVATSEEFEDTALVVLEQEIGVVGDRPLYRYHLCNNWHFAYWKARAYLTACVVIAWNAKAYLLGRRVPIELIRQYTEGTHFLEYEIDGALPTSGLHWHPEDMALKPEAFLDGLDDGAFGIREGLSLWLQLDAAGFMKTDLPYANVRQAFEQALAKAPSSC